MIRPSIGGAAVAVVLMMGAATFATVSCPADINSDNKVDVDDLFAVINRWGACPAPCSPDIVPLGGNGVVNTDDLFGVINNWGPCLTCSPANGCLQATHLWCENFELNNFTRWTGGYSPPSSCESTAFTSEQFRDGVRSHKSRVLCATADSHRGYGGLRFQGDTVLSSFTIPSTGGINAPYGVVITMWSWVQSSYTFDSNRWLSLLTCTDDCSNSWNGVVTLNIDDSSMRLKPVHVTTVTYATNAPAFPRGQWNRITVYLNYYDGVMHVWQNGQKVCNAAFTRAVHTMCQWHFGLYASGPNSDITLYEDDYSMVKLNQPMVNFTLEPYFPSVISPCAIVPP